MARQHIERPDDFRAVFADRSAAFRLGGVVAVDVCAALLHGVELRDVVHLAADPMARTVLSDTVDVPDQMKNDTKSNRYCCCPSVE